MSLLIKNLIFTLVAPGMVAVAIPLLIGPGGWPRASASAALGAPLLVAGVAIYAWCVWDFASFGRGTPAPIDAPKKLVVRGLYRYSRNPMYVGVLTVIAAWSVLYRSAPIALYGCAVALVFHTFVRLYEEPHLRREFGREYSDYVARVGRWLPRRPGERPG